MNFLLSNTTGATRGAGTVYSSWALFLISGICIAQSLVFCVMFCRSIIVCHFVLFLAAIVLSVFLQLMTSDYPFDIFIHFFEKNKNEPHPSIIIWVFQYLYILYAHHLFFCWYWYFYSCVKAPFNIIMWHFNPFLRGDYCNWNIDKIAMKKWPYIRGDLSWGGQISSILLSKCNWNLGC